MKKKHFNIPLFIPELACPFQCIYCNQRKISGQLVVPSAEEITTKIDKHLETISEKNSEVEVAFFGGNFTGLKIDEQVEYLEVVQPYVQKGKISGIRLSTRPDYINEEALNILKNYNVKTIELGAQSMDDEVLKLSKRGHTAVDTENTSKLILEAGFSLGLQMMIGLPGDTLDKAIYTAKKIVELGANNTRIYPCLVIKGTKLEEMYRSGKYKPLSLDEAVLWSKELLKIFESSGVDVIKMGLHPSEGLLSGEELIAGPFHQSFRELVLTEIWWDLLEPLLKREESKFDIYVPKGQINYAVGYNAQNKKRFKDKEVKFIADQNFKGRDFKIISLE